MANYLNAIQTYGPRLVRGKTVQKRELVKLLAGRTGFNSSEVSGMLDELRDAVIFYALTGRGVKLEGVGSFLPYIKQDGRLVISHRADRQILSALNADGEFTGEIINRDNIGKSTEELVALWNAENPDDPVES